MIRRTSRGWIGIDLGTSCVKIAQLIRKPDGYALRATQLVRRVQPWTTDESDRTQGLESAAEIRAAIQMCESVRGSVAAAIPSMKLCNVHAIRTESDDLTDIASQIARDVSRNATQGGGDLVYEFWTNPRDRSNASAENAISLAMPEKWASRCASDIEKAGLRCQVLDGLPLALARASTLDPRCKRHTLCVDCGFSTTTLCIVEQGSCLFVRSLPKLGLRKMIDELVAQTSLDKDRVSRLLFDGQALKTTSISSGSTVDDMLLENRRRYIEHVSDEIKQTLLYLQTHWADLTPASILLFGGGASLQGVDGLIQESTGCTTSIFRPHLTEDVPSGMPMHLFGPAMALSQLAWRQQ